MEIHDKPVHENRPLRRNAAERPIDFTRPLREGLRAFREMQAEGDRAEAERGDRLELSAEARELAEAEAAGKAREAASSREERVEALRRAIADGALNSSERIDRAAREMLGG